MGEPDADTEPRESGCQFHWEAGDSPCRVHGEERDAAPTEKPEWLAELHSLTDAATEGPWFYNSYAGVFSEPLSLRYMQMEVELDARLKAEARESTDDDFAAFPDSLVCGVPVVGGDTATGQGRRDAAFIAAARGAVPKLLALVDGLMRERDEARASGERSK
jgi:hypothetical protein